MTSSSSESIAFVGVGAMGSALARGAIAAGVVQPDHAVLYDAVPAVAAALAGQTGASAAPSMAAAVQAADTVVLAVKPKDVPAALAEMAPFIAPRHLLVVVAAGVRLATIEASLPEGVPVVRVMPNTPCLVGAGASAYALGRAVQQHHRERVVRLLRASGTAEQVPEDLMDAVTGLSGSGPAYVFLAIEAMADGGVRMGLPRALALRLAAQTCLGAAKMVLDTGDHPAALKDKVASPGGTTIAGLQALEEGAVRASFIKAVELAAKRSAELGG